MKQKRNICIPAAGLLASEVLLSSLRLLFAVPAQAAGASVQQYAQEILTAECGGQTVQEWVDSTLTSRVGMSSPDWYVMALAGNYDVNLSGYAHALTDYLAHETVINASSRERLALALTACGGGASAVCTDILDSSAEENGIMSRIFGLHLLNNGVKSSKYENSQLASALVDLQAPDGGWSLQGTRGDTDVTAMTLQALAPYRNEPEVSAAVQRGIGFLADTQLPSGAYQSYGAENPESTAQVMIALCCLGIDPLTDSRFQQNGHTLLDGILQFRIAEGQYAHAMGGAANTMATVQVFTALTAAEMQQSGKGSFYLFHGASPRWQRQTVTAQPVQTQTSQTGTPASRSTATTATVTGGTQTPGSAQQPVITGGTGSSSSGSGTDTQPLTGGTEDTTAFGTSSAAGSITQETETTAESAAGTSGTARTTAPAQPIRTEREKYPYRIPLTAAAGAVCGGAVLFFILRKQKSPKTYLTIAGVFCAATALIWFIKIESPEQFYTPEAHTGGGNVTMEIRCDVIRGLPGSEAYPADGIIMPLTEFSIEPDENALTLLYDAVKAYQLQIEVDGVSGDVVETAYVRGIASLYEFDFGDLSGWTYTVNGERPSVGCGSFTLHDGDVIAWIYTIDL